MKKATKFFAAALAIVAAASCQKEMMQEITPAGKLVPVTISAEIENTKADLGLDGKVTWSADDSIAVWTVVPAEGTTPAPVKSVLKLASGAGETSGSFSGLLPEGSEITAAVYPYSAAASTDLDSLKTVQFTAKLAQTVPAGKAADPEAVIMTAKGGSSLMFTNPCGALMVELPAGVKFVTLTSEKVSASVVLPGTAGKYYVMLPAGDYAGFKAAYNISGSHCVKATEKTLNIAAGKITKMPVPAVADVTIPETISTLAEFKAWASVANTYAPGENVKLGTDIDLAEGGVNCSWTPLIFAGNFDGQNHIIKGYSVKASDQKYNADDYMYLGFFGYITGALKNAQFGTKGGNDAVVVADENSTVGDGYHLNVGGVVGRCTKGWIENVKSYATVSYEATSYKFRIAGLCGHFQSAQLPENAKYSMLNCLFDGTVAIKAMPTPKTSYAAGLIGFSQAALLVRSCTNLGQITEDASCAARLQPILFGGIVGQDGSSSAGHGAVYSNCVNGKAGDAEAGKIEVNLGASSSGTTYTYVGGIAGANYATLSYCFNYAPLSVRYIAKEASGKASDRIGGITGYETTANAGNIDNCANFGAVYQGFVNTTRATSGGIVGYAQTFTTTADSGNIYNCLSAGNVITEGNAYTRNGYIIGCQATSGKWGTDEAPMMIAAGTKIIYNYTAGAAEYVADAETIAKYAEGSSSKVATMKAVLVASAEEGLAKLKDRYAE